MPAVLRNYLNLMGDVHGTKNNEIKTVGFDL